MVAEPERPLRRCASAPHASSTAPHSSVGAAAAVDGVAWTSSVATVSAGTRPAATHGEISPRQPASSASSANGAHAAR